MKVVRIATRGSPLALTQAGVVAKALERALGVATERVIIKTSGDRIQDAPLADLGGKGLFVKEIEEALLEDRADLAVHSAKDLPGAGPPGLTLAAFPPRADARDALVARVSGSSLAALAAGARVGTGSLRRGSQMLAQRPDLVVEPLRGNVDTRLSRLDAGDLDAVVLACAGLDRLGLGERIDERIDPARMLPAPGQGALALQVRAGEGLADALAVLDDAATRGAVVAERAFLTRLGGDCNLPLAAYAEVVDGCVSLRGLVASPDGKQLVRGEAEASVADAAAAGLAAAAAVVEAGGAEILAALGVEPAP